MNENNKCGWCGKTIKYNGVAICAECTCERPMNEEQYRTFEEWFKQYLRDNFLVEVDYGQKDLPPSIARQCATAAWNEATRIERERCLNIIIARYPELGAAI